MIGIGLGCAGNPLYINWSSGHLLPGGNLYNVPHRNGYNGHPLKPRIKETVVMLSNPYGIDLLINDNENGMIFK